MNQSKKSIPFINLNMTLIETDDNMQSTFRQKHRDIGSSLEKTAKTDDFSFQELYNIDNEFKEKKKILSDGVEEKVVYVPVEVEPEIEEIKVVEEVEEIKEVGEIEEAGEIEVKEEGIEREVTGVEEENSTAQVTMTDAGSGSVGEYDYIESLSVIEMVQGVLQGMMAEIKGFEADRQEVRFSENDKRLQERLQIMEKKIDDNKQTLQID